MKLSIVIPSHKDAAGLWYTVVAALADLENDFAPGEYEIIGVIDGPEDDQSIITNMKQQKMCKLLFTNTGTPQKNRHIGLLEAEADYVFFLDSHVIPSRGFFKRVLQTAEEHSDVAIVHAAHCFWKRDKMNFGYNMDWMNYFWSFKSEIAPQRSDAAYPICLSGHGAMCVNKKLYLQIGGYWDALQGWGGEEPQLNLKVWLLGYRILMEPRVYHWHFMPSKRQLKEVQHSLPYARNFLLVAYASGGQQYLEYVYHFFTQMENRHATLEEAIHAKPQAPYQELYDTIPQIAAAERATISGGPFAGDLDKLREFFTTNGIPH